MNKPAQSLSTYLPSSTPSKKTCAGEVVVVVSIDGATRVESRAMSAEISTGIKRDEYDDVVSKEVKKEDAGGVVGGGVGGAAGAAPAAAAPVQAQPAKAPVSGKFKLMKMMNKKK